MTVRLSGFCALLLSIPCLASAQITTRLGALPPALEEGRPLAITVQYDVPAKFGTVSMHVELKDTKAVVLQSSSPKVSGKGTQSLTFTVPLRSVADQITFAVWYGDDWTKSLAPVVFGEVIPVLTQAQASDLAAQSQAAQAWMARRKDRLARGPVPAILDDEVPGLDHALVQRVTERMKAVGMEPVALSVAEVANPSLLTPANISCLVLTNAATCPAEAGPALSRYAAQGGSLLALGTPAFQQVVRRVGDRWMSDQELRAALAAVKAEKILFDFESGNPADWSHTGSPGPAGQWEYAAGGADGTGNALKCTVPNFTGWNTFVSPAVPQPFATGQTLTTFWAKGGPATTQLDVEWTEQDGSRWIAVVPLTTEWQHFALAPEAFEYWHDNTSKGRGGSTDSFKPANAAKLTLGLAKTHTRLGDGRHEFWVDQIGTARNPYGMTRLTLDMPPMDGLTPAYKFHRVSEAASLRVSDKQGLLSPAEFTVPRGLMSLQPRPQGTGYNKDRKWRFVPLLEAFNKQGEVCGTPAALIINQVGGTAGSQIASFALPASSFENQALLDLVARVALRMRDRVFLFEGGAEYFAYFQGEEVKLGARLAATGSASSTSTAKPAAVKFFVTSDIGTEFEMTVALKDGKAETTWKPGQFAKRTYEVLCTLVDSGGNMLDMLRHPLLVWEPARDPQFMQISNGHFYLRGKPWYAHGVNYMPSSGIGTEDGEYFEYWMGSQPYDPVIIERDLSRVEAMGFNCVSIFCYYRSLESRNLLDILERCRRHNLMVNLSLRPGTPLDFRWDEMKALLQTYRLAQNDTVFAYDLAWEPMFGNYAKRLRWDGEWEAWILQRYGSLASAEADWGMPVPRADGKVTGPSDEQLTKEGKHRVMVCAYRRFLDDLLAKHHSLANGLVKSVDPNHFTSFRMTIAGDPTASPTSCAYDFRGLARSCDIMEPEAYGRHGAWENVQRGRFTVDYARCVAPGRPVMWAEFGLAPYGPDALDASLQAQEATADHYRLFCRMARESDSDGTICWWYPGGYRVGERSDYGVLNGDGSWRPVSHVIHDQAARMTSPRPSQPVDEWLTVDRDASVRGVAGMYESVAQRYTRLINAGKNPGLRTDGYGLDSATAPLIAVGNVPYRLRGNPHKYLNAEFDQLQIQDAQGRYRTVTKGSVIKLRRGAPVMVRAIVGNLGEAKWLSAEGHGQVVLTCGEAFTPLPRDVQPLGTIRLQDFQVCELQESMDLVFQMGVWSPEILFGEQVQVRVEVQ
jgi:hypothetical protein